MKGGQQFMRNGKGGWWKKFCKFWESINKREEPSDQMEEIQSVTDSDEESEFIFVPMIVMVVLAVICIGVSLCFFKWE